MTCDSQRMDDKKEAFENATADVNTAERAHRDAVVAVGVLCGAVLVNPVLAAGPCLVAMSNMDTKADDFWSALGKKDRASNGYNQAKAAYDKCVTKLKAAKKQT